MKKAIFVVLCVNALLLAGRYWQELVHAQAQPPICTTMNGDVNVDGHIDISDAVIILRHIILGDPAELVPICEAQGGDLGPVVELLTRIADRPPVDLRPIVDKIEELRSTTVDELGQLRATIESPSPVAWEYKFLELRPLQEVEVVTGAGLLHGIVYRANGLLRFDLRDGPQGNRIVSPSGGSTVYQFLPLDVRFDRGLYVKNTIPVGEHTVFMTVIYRSSE